MGQGNIIGKPNLPVTARAKGVWSLREQYLANRSGTWPGYDPQWPNTTLLLKTASVAADTFIDSSPNAFTVTRNGDTIQTTSTPYAPYWSNFFDGSGDYLTGSAPLSTSTGMSTFTIEGWVCPTTFANRINIIGDMNPTSASDTKVLAAEVNTSGQVVLYWYDGSIKRCTGNTAMTLNQWNYFAIVVNANAISIYVNKTTADTLSGTTTLTTRTQNNNFALGAYFNETPFAGYLSNIRVSTVARSITAVPTAPLTADANTRLLVCQDNRFKDNSTNNLTLTKTGDVAVSRFSPFAWAWSAASGGSVFLDGTGDYMTVPGDTSLAFGTGDFTIEFWTLPTGLGDHLFLDFRPASTNGAYPGVSQIGGAITYETQAASRITGATLTVGQWHHVAVTRSGTSTRLWLNGVQTGSTYTDTNNYLCGTNRPMISGNGFTGGTQNFVNGHISNLRIVKGTALYTANFTPPAAPVTAIANTSLLLNFTNAAHSDTASGNVVRPVGTTVSRGNVAPSTDLTSTGLFASGDYLTVSSPSGQLGGGDFTVEAWVYPTARTGTYPTLWCNYSTWTTGSFAIFIAHASNTTKYSVGFNGVHPALVSTTDVVYGQWTHLAVVRSNGVTRLYVNGVSEGGTYASTAVQNQGTGASWVGVPGDAVTGNTYTGFISNLRVERSARYTANFTPDRTPITTTANTALALSQTVDVWDETRKNNLSSTGTIVATPNMFTGSALSLAGNPQLARAYGTLAANFAFGTGDFTIEAWIYPTSTSSYRTIFSTRGAVAAAVWFGLNNGTYNLLYATANVDVLVSTRAVTANAWSHVALVRSNGVVCFYIDGVPAGSTANTTNLTESTAVIGFSVQDNQFGFIGQIDDLRVSRAARYTGTFLPSTTPLAQDWEPFYNDTQSGTNVLQLKSIDVGGASNNVFRDDSSNNFTVTRNGDTTQGSLSPYIPYGYWSGYFDGSGDYLTLPANAAYAMGTGDFTVECWVMFTGINGVANGIFQTGTSHFPAGVTNSIALGTSTSGSTWQIYAKNTNTNSTATWRLGQWYHCAVVRASGTTRLYINGTSVITVTADTADYTGTFLGIGAIYSTSYSQNGYISDFRVVKGTAVYTADFTPPNRLTAITNTSLLTLQDNRFIDKSVNNFAITRTGDVAISRYAPFPFGVPVQTTAATNPGSAYFDGTGDWLAAPNAAANFTNQNFTAESWVYFTTNSIGYQPIMGNTGTADAQGWIVIVETNNLVYAYFSTSGSGWTQSLGGSFTPPINAWTHFALVRNGTTITLYANGASIGSTTIGTGTIHSPTGAFYAGYYPFFPGGARSLNGYMSNIRLVTGTAVYTSAFTTPTTPLTAITNTSLLTAQNANAINADSSTNNRTVTIGGDAKGNDLSPFPTSQRVTYTYGGSGYFDGTGDYLSVPNSSVFNMGTGAFTVEFWMNPAAAPTGFAATMVSTYNGGSQGWEVQWRTSPQAIRFGFGDTALIDRDFLSSIYLNQWTHIAVAREANGNTRMFFNGVQQGAVTALGSYSLDSTGPLYLGLLSPATGQNFTGFLSNVRVVKGSAVYTANFTPPTSPVTAISGTSLLLNFANAGVYDGTGRQNIITAGTSNSSTVQKKHDLASQLVTANVGGFIPVPATSPNYVFGTGDFTVEFWLYRNVVAQQVIYDQRPTSTQGVYPTIYCEGATLNYYVSTGNRITGPSLAAGQWYHIAVSRAASQTRLFVDGVQQGATYADTNSYICGTNRPMIGNNGFAADYQFNGYIENLRISRVGRYTANFTVPSESFPVA